jgi:hypothetical protein
MTSQDILLQLGPFFTAVLGALGLWWKLEGRIKAAENAATLKAEAAVASAQILAAQLAEYKLHVSETYVTKSGLRETTEQIMAAIGDVKSSVNGLTTRLDRIIEERRT